MCDYGKFLISGPGQLPGKLRSFVDARANGKVAPITEISRSGVV
jgi:hypothetical protein